MIRRAKASSAGLTPGLGSRPRSVGHAFAGRRSSDVSGSHSATIKAFTRVSLALALSLAAVFAFTATPAFAKPIHNFETSFGAAGAGDGQVSLASNSGVAVNDTTHNVYVADTNNHRVDEFTSAGAFVRAFGADVGGAGVNVCTSGCVIGTSTVAAGGFESPTFVAVDNGALSSSKGDVYVADTAAKLVSKFDSEGHLITSWGTGGQLNGSAATGGPFSEIAGIAVDGSGRLFVYSGAQELWFEFSQNGTAEPTVSVGRGTTPVGIAVDNLGHFYKAVGFDSVEKYSSAGVDLGGIDEGTEAGGGADTGFAINLASNDIYIDQSGGSQIGHFLPSCASGSTYSCPRADTFGSAQLSGGAGVGVDSSNGTVYVADTGHSRIDSFIAAIIPDVTTGPATQLEQHIATLHGEVDPAGGPEVTGCQFAYVEAAHYEPQAANPYAAGGTHSCAPPPGYTSPQAVSAALTAGLNPDTTYHFRLEASNEKGTNQSADETFTTTGPPLVKEEHVTNIEPTTAILRAAVNPSGYPATYQFEYGTGSVGEFHAPATPQPVSGSEHADEPVQVGISGLDPETTYLWRVVARGECEPVANPGHICVAEGPVEEFTTLEAVSVRNVTTQTVGPELVKLKAEINPNNSIATTHFAFHLGTDTSYSFPPVEGTLTTGSEFVSETAIFENLKPNTEYHYQFTAENEYGDTETTDQIFTTEPSGAEERAAEAACLNGSPNSTLREENNSQALPDCRAYEQVSERFKQGGEAFPSFGLSPSGERVYYSSEGLFANAPTNPLAIFYLTHRTPSGWVTQSLVARLLAGMEPLPALGDMTAEMDHWLFLEEPGLSSGSAGGNQPSGFFSMGSVDGSYIAHASPTIGPLQGEPGSGPLNPLESYMNVIGLSHDLSHAFIATGARLLPESEDPRPGDYTLGGETRANSRIYEINGVGEPGGGALRLAAEVPLGIEVNRGSQECELDARETIGRLPKNRPPFLSSEDGSVIVYTLPIEREAGKGCGFESPNPYGIYASTNGGAAVLLNTPLPSQCTGGSPCATAETETPLYDGASPDGRNVWFTTTQPLVNSDTDNTNDLYMAKLSPSGQLEELVQASAGETNADHTAGEGAELGEEGITAEGASVNQGVVRISEDGTHVAFESPAVLTTHENALEQSAVKGANNLYVYNAGTGETKFVTELCSGPEASGTQLSSATSLGNHNVEVGVDAIRDRACPATVNPQVQSFTLPEGNDDGLWLGGGPGGEAVFTPDGGYLLFSSFGRLASGDTDNIQDLYRYDFQTGQLERISFGRNGNDGNGNDNTYPAEFPGDTEAGTHTLGEPSMVAENGGRTISADGSTVIFRTTAPLVSEDTNTGVHASCRGSFEANVPGTSCDIYEWEGAGHGSCNEVGGCIRLISDGVSQQGTKVAVIGGSGNDITFQTQSDLVPADTDGVGDIYDARVNGGFPAPAPPAACGGPENCRNTAQAEPAIPNIGTENFASSGNSKTQLTCGKGRHRVKKHGEFRCVAANRHHRRHKHGHGGGHGGGK